MVAVPIRLSKHTAVMHYRIHSRADPVGELLLQNSLDHRSGTIRREQTQGLKRCLINLRFVQLLFLHSMPAADPNIGLNADRKATTLLNALRFVALQAVDRPSSVSFIRKHGCCYSICQTILVRSIYGIFICFFLCMLK